MLYYDDENQDEDHVNSKRHAREGMRKKKPAAAAANAGTVEKLSYTTKLCLHAAGSKKN